MTGIKNKLIWAVCLIALFIPTYIGIWAYSSAQKAPVKDGAVTRMELTDLAGTAYTIDGNTAAEGFNGSVLSYFLSLNDDAKSVGDIPDQLVNANYFKAVYYSYDLSTTYRYYFSADPENAYYVDSAGTAYKITSADASIFIQSAYGISIFPASNPPTMIFGDGGTEILPTSMTWQCLSYGNTYKQVDVPIASETDKQSVTLLGGLDMRFSVQPDYLLVNIKQDGVTVYDDLYENIASYTFAEGSNLTVTITAKWYQDDERGAYGEAIYEYNANVKAAPVFYLGETSIEPGEFVVLTGKNVTDISTITFASEPTINYTPVFYQDGSNVRALIPISVELPDATAYTFTITSGGVTQTVSLSIETKAFKSKDVTVSSQDLAAKYTADTLKEFNDGVAAYLTASDSTKYWSGVFAEGVTDRYITAGFGIYRKLSGTYGTGESYRNPGVDYIVSQGDNAVADNAGKIIFVGEFALTGKTVIIEHGFGLKSLYAYLGDVTVKVGDTVKTGDIIGTVGTTGFTSGYGFQYRLYVNSIPVCPYSLWEHGIPMTD
jgi:Membrane proteins related to metalloendopeptidases